MLLTNETHARNVDTHRLDAEITRLSHQLVRRIDINDLRLVYEPRHRAERLFEREVQHRACDHKVFKKDLQAIEKLLSAGLGRKPDTVGQHEAAIDATVQTIKGLVADLVDKSKVTPAESDDVENGRDASVDARVQLLVPGQSQSMGTRTEYDLLEHFYLILESFVRFTRWDREDMEAHIIKLIAQHQAYRLPEGPDDEKKDDESALSAWEHAIVDVSRLLSTTALNDEAAPEQHGEMASKTNIPSLALRPLTVAELNTAKIMIKLHVYEGGDLSPATFQDASCSVIRAVQSVPYYAAVQKAGDYLAQAHDITQRTQIRVTVKKNLESLTARTLSSVS